MECWSVDPELMEKIRLDIETYISDVVSGCYVFLRFPSNKRGGKIIAHPFEVSRPKHFGIEGNYYDTNAKILDLHGYMSKAQ